MKKRDPFGFIVQIREKNIYLGTVLSTCCGIELRDNTIFLTPSSRHIKAYIEENIKYINEMARDYHGSYRVTVEVLDPAAEAVETSPAPAARPPEAEDPPADLSAGKESAYLEEIKMLREKLEALESVFIEHIHDKCDGQVYKPVRM